MAIDNFDKFILRFPDLDREPDFHEFWKEALAGIKKIPLEPVLKKNAKKSGSLFIYYDVSFKGYNKSAITGELLLPHNFEKPPVIVLIHDYNTPPDFSGKLSAIPVTDSPVAYFIITLRGHTVLPEKNTEGPESPGYMVENILEKNEYYVKGVYLDSYRSIEVLRLVNKLNCNSIGIYGKGLGAACAIFMASFSERVGAMVLDSPSFCDLALSQNISDSDATDEINQFLSLMKGKKKQVKKNLTYFDALNFTDMVSVPVLTAVGFKDTISPPECVFALFNRLTCEKTIEVYPEDGYDAGGKKQFAKSIAWLINEIKKYANPARRD